MAGDAETGVCVMQIEEGLDTGPVFACERVPIAPTTTADELRAALVEVGTPLLVETLRHGLGASTPQQGEPVYAAKVEPRELQLDWSRPPEELARLVRVGGAWTTFRGKRLKVLDATVADGQLRLEVVQPEGKAPMTVAAWRNGAHPTPGELPGV